VWRVNSGKAANRCCVVQASKGEHVSQPVAVVIEKRISETGKRQNYLSGFGNQMDEGKRRVNLDSEIQDLPDTYLPACVSTSV
jgi:hypothetical protein